MKTILSLAGKIALLIVLAAIIVFGVIGLIQVIGG